MNFERRLALRPVVRQPGRARGAVSHGNQLGATRMRITITRWTMIDSSTPSRQEMA